MQISVVTVRGGNPGCRQHRPDADGLQTKNGMHRQRVLRSTLAGGVIVYRRFSVQQWAGKRVLEGTLISACIIRS